MNNYQIKLSNFLNEYPLYDYQSENKISVTIISFGSAYRDFLSTVIEAAQSISSSLEVTVYSDDPQKELDDLLAKWPAIGDFFEINSSKLNHAVDSYGKIDFVQYSKIENNLNKKQLKYVYVNCGDKSQETASKLANYVNGVLLYENNQKQLFIVSSNKEFEYNYDEVDENIDRLAFNSHLIWLRNTNGKTLEEIHNEFLGSRNYDSSYSLAVSYKYKLHSLGLDVDDINNSARELEKLVKEDSKTVAKLAYLEHRRWCVSRIVLGTTAPKGEGLSKYDYIFDEKNFSQGDYSRQKCSKINIHSCLTHSRPEIRIDKKYDWENGSLEKLDELDKMSIELHRAYKQKSDEYWKNHDLASDFDLVEIGRIIGNAKDIDLSYELEKYKLTIFGILNHNKGHAENYFNVLSEFEKMLKNNPNVFDRVKGNLDGLTYKLFPAIKAYSYEDYKSKDFDIIYGLPFVLTFDYHNRLGMSLVVPSSKEKVKDTISNNIAPVAFVKPTSVSYIVEINNANRQYVSMMIKSCCGYINAHYKTKISLLILTDIEDKSLTNVLLGLKKNGVIDSFDFVTKIDHESDATESMSFLEKNEINQFVFNGNTSINISFVSKLNDCFNSCQLDLSDERLFKDSSPSYSNTKFKYLYAVRCLGGEYISFSDMIYMLDNKSKIGCDYFVTKNEVEFLWNKLFKSNLKDSTELYIRFCDYIKDNRVNKVNAIFNNDEYQKFAPIIDIIEEGGFAEHKEEGDAHILHFLSKSVLMIFVKHGDLFERHCYYECINSGYFDEILSGVKFKYENNQSANELDLVLVKGFKTVIVECKAMFNDPKEEIVWKLQYICTYFGLNTKGVLAFVRKFDGKNNTISLADYSSIEVLDNLAREDNIADKLIKIISK